MSDFDAPLDSSPAGGDTSAPAASPIQTPSASPVATPPGSAAAPTAAPEDRSTWIPPHRLREVSNTYRQAQEQWGQQETQYKTELQRVQQQLQALVGVTPQQRTEVDAIREQFGQVYPGLSKLEERAQHLMDMLERSGDLESQNQHYWQSYGRQQMDRLFSSASDSFGAPLTDDAKRSLHASFVGWIQQSPDRQERYASDPSVVDEFWKAFSSNFIDPVRRSATVTAGSRIGANLPLDTPGGAPRATPAPQFDNDDQRLASGWAQYQSQAAKPRFGG